MAVTTLPNNPSLAGMAKMLPDIVYSSATGQALKAAILTPLSDENKKKPAVIFVQGSGWTDPSICSKIPQLSPLAREGYFIMTVSHRNAMAGHPFPAFLQDVKCAIRYLRAHAEEYGVDPERIAIFGTSSGGNTALLVAMTGDDPRYKTEEYAQYSDSVCCMVECFGPSWIEKMPEDALEWPVFTALHGERDRLEVFREMSPYCIADEKKDYPPMLILQGDADPVVPYEQSLALYEKMQGMGKRADLVRVEGGVHEKTFWTQAAYDLIFDFLRKHLGC